MENKLGGTCGTIGGRSEVRKAFWLGLLKRIYCLGDVRADGWRCWEQLKCIRPRHLGISSHLVVSATRHVHLILIYFIVHQYTLPFRNLRYMRRSRSSRTVEPRGKEKLLVVEDTNYEVSCCKICSTFSYFNPLGSKYLPNIQSSIEFKPCDVVKPRNKLLKQ
jgi:hypothetical protein